MPVTNGKVDPGFQRATGVSSLYIIICQFIFGTMMRPYNVSHNGCEHRLPVTNGKEIPGSNRQPVRAAYICAICQLRFDTHEATIQCITYWMKHRLPVTNGTVDPGFQQATGVRSLHMHYLPIHIWLTRNYHIVYDILDANTGCLYQMGK